MQEFLRGIFYLLLGALGGYLSATATIGSIGASPAGAGAGGQWQYWDIAPASTAHPYAIAHYLLAGRFPPPSGQILEFVTDRDKDGNAIDGDCVYSVTGKPPAARWWSIAIPESGAAANPVVTAETAVLDANGLLTVTISRHAAPGNWLRPASGDDYSLIYAVTETEAASGIATPPPFTVTRTEC
ncbi:MAG: DUF1214 domain-containing protein [Hyphomicrobiales bacterium]